MPPERTAECSWPTADCNWRASPNPDALLRCYEHSVGGLHFKGGVPDISVLTGTNHAQIDAENVDRLRRAPAMVMFE